MHVAITGLAGIRAYLGRLRPDEIMKAALAEQAERIAEAVRANLSECPDSGDHDMPWVQTSALRDSIEATADGLEAAIGSNDRAAAPQEIGTSRIPPRPFLAPVVAALGEKVAQSIGDTIVATLKGEDFQETVCFGGGPRMRAD